MRRGISTGNIFVWVLVIFLYFGSSFFESIGKVNAEVEYDSNMRTDNYQVSVTLGEDNSYLVSEVIRVNMLTSRHGIYRYIPQKGYSETYNIDGGTARMPYYADVELVSANVPVHTENKDGFFVMKLGRESQVVRGEQTYQLEYRVTPRFQQKNYPCAYYNVLPITWQNSIPAGSRFQVEFPKDFDHDNLKFYYGQYGSTADGEEILNLSWQGNTVTGTLKEALPFLSGVTMFANMGEGYFTKTHTIGNINLLILVVALIVLVIVAVLFLFFGRDEEMTPSIQYQPPDGLDSAAVGYIIDGHVEDKDILSLIIYWADQGYLKIEERDPSKKKAKIFFIRTDKRFPANAPRYQTVLFEKIFKKGNEVSLGSLKYQCSETISVCKTQLRAYITGKGGIYTGASKIARGVSSILGILPMAVFVVVLAVFSKLSIWRILFYVLDVAVLFVGICLFNNIIDNWYARNTSQRRRMCIFGLGLSMVSISALAGSYLMQWRQNEVFDLTIALAVMAVVSGVCVLLTGFMKKRTHRCVEWMGYLAGLRDFIETAELDRLKAMAEENPEWFYHILPYAYVFGLSDAFAKKLEGLAIPAPQWYISYAPNYGYWNYYHFHRAFMGNMLTVTQALTVAEPVKASGFNSGGGSGGMGGGFGGGFSGGGGGFSGGGFGGGGGGSW